MQRLLLSNVVAALPASVVTIGNFDGVHRGHRALIDVALGWGRTERLSVTVCTFDPHPMRVLNPSRAPRALMTLDQKAEALEQLGVARLVVAPFTLELAAVPAGTFGRGVIAGQLGARVVVVGPGFRFGAGARGDVTTLRVLGSELGFGLHEVPAAVWEGKAISSTRVRELLASGAVAPARALLGRPFANDGPVVRGEGRGRLLGIPTANVSPLNETVPANGVYSAWCRRRQGSDWGHAWPAVVNVGVRPTFAGADRRVEAHLLGFEGNLYGELLRVEYWQRLRDEQRFASPEALVQQIGEDVARARKSLETD